MDITSLIIVIQWRHWVTLNKNGPLNIAYELKLNIICEPVELMETFHHAQNWVQFDPLTDCLCRVTRYRLVALSRNVSLTHFDSGKQLTAGGLLFHECTRIVLRRWLAVSSLTLLRSARPTVLEHLTNYTHSLKCFSEMRQFYDDVRTAQILENSDCRSTCSKTKFTIRIPYYSSYYIIVRRDLVERGHTGVDYCNIMCSLL